MPKNEIVGARGMTHRRENDYLGTCIIPGRAVWFSLSESDPGPVPAVRDQAEEVLVALGQYGADVEALRERGVVR